MGALPEGPRTGTTRLETDSLGSVAVPSEALYGARTVRALGNLSFSGRSLGGCRPYVRALGFVKQAAARANREAGVVGAEPAAAIDAAATQMVDLQLLDHLPVDLLGGGGSIGVHVNVNEVLANVANETMGGRRGEYRPVRPGDVGASQSTADVCHTALRLAALWPFGLNPYFASGGFASDDPDRREIARIAWMRLRELSGIPFGPLEVTVVGDTVHDVACAQANGFRSLALASGWGVRSDLERAGPDTLLDDLSDLPRALVALGIGR